MKIENFLRQSINELNNPNKSESTRPNFFKLYVEFVKVFLKMIWPFQKRKDAFEYLFSTIGFLLLIGASARVEIISIDSLEQPWYEELPLLILNFLLTLLVFVFFLSILLFLYVPNKLFKKTYKKYLKNGSLQFTNEEYKLAADVLEEIKPQPLDEAVREYGERVIDLLVLTKSVDLMSRRKAPFKKEVVLQRIVSIKSIEKDTEAGWDE